MHVTDQVPAVPLKSFKRTKIIATVGPATDSAEAIHSLIAAGVNGIRLNFSHGTHEEHGRRIPWVRQASNELGKPVAVIQDLQGPKIRLGDFDDIINVETDQSLSFAYKSDYASTGHIPTQYDLSRKVKPGERLYLFDGRVRTTVTAVREGIVYAKAENNGILIKRKGINLPDTDFGGDILTKKDLDDIVFGATQDIDYVALSFVQTAGDVENLRKVLNKHGSTAKIIVKVETKAAVENIEEIVKASDMIMVARGDLAVETPSETVPVVQRHIIGLGQQYDKPTIVATQMLLSMVDMPEPTRAEVSDVATAVFLGADCVMLSDETAMGKHPVQTVKTMKRVIKYAEQHPPLKTIYPFDRPHSIQNAISSSVINLAVNIDAKAIVTETKSGATAFRIAARRPNEIIIAVTNEERVAQQLTLVYGIKSYVRPADPQAATKLTDWLRQNEILHSQDIVVTVSGRRPGVMGTTDTIKVRVLE
jgi:pyruvate kinase